jgi:glycosyltransferase involved in cell wall biosynthesis
VHVIAPAAAGLAASEHFDGVLVERFRYAPRKFERLAYTGSMAQDVRNSWSARLTLLTFLGSEFVTAVLSGRRFHPDLVHAHWWFPGGLVGTWVASLAAVPLVTTLHGSDVRLVRTAVAARPAFRHVVRKSAALTTVSRWLARELDELVPSANATIAPMPVDTALFTPGGERTPDRLLFIGRLNAQKGIEHLVAALPLVRACASLDVVGDGPSLPALRALAGPTVRFHGRLPDASVTELMECCRAVCVCGAEDFGLAPLEANAAGKPVVALAAGGALETLEDGVNAALFAEPTVDAALAAIRRADAIETPPEEIRANALRFSPDAFACALLAALERIRERAGSMFGP